MSTDWLPRTRVAQLEMAKRWYPLVNTQKTAWKIPATEVTRLDAAITRVDEEQADFVLKATPGNRARVRAAGRSPRRPRRKVTVTFFRARFSNFALFFVTFVIFCKANPAPAQYMCGGGNEETQKTDDA